MKPKVYLNLEHKGLVKISGIGTAFDHQKKALKLTGVEFTTKKTDDMDLVHINFFGLGSYRLAKRYKRLGKKVIIHTHTTAEDLKNSFRLTNLINPLFKRYLKKYYGLADLLISPSKYTRRLLIKCYGLDKKKIISISNGIDFEKFQGYDSLREAYRKKFNLHGPVCFTVGHVFRRKGVHDFIEIAKRFPGITFIWFGPIYNSFLANTRKILKNKPPNVIFSGFVDDIRGAYAAGDIFFFPSYSENQGIAVLEAAATRHPLIVRNLPTYRGWLKHLENAMVCADNKEFYESIRSLLKDKGLRKKMAKNAYDMSKDHDLKIIGKRLKEAYENLEDL